MFLWVYIKVENVLTFVILPFILDYSFGPKKDKLFCPVFVFCRGMPMSSAKWICVASAKQRLKGFINISWYNSIPVIKNGIHNVVLFSVANWKPLFFPKWNGSIWDLGGKFRQKWMHSFWDFWILSFIFFSKEKNKRNTHNQNVGELAYCIIVFYTQEFLTCFDNRGILVGH